MTTTAIEGIASSRRTAIALPFLVLGAAGIVAGGVSAAVSASAPSRLGAWSAAYLVLVVGVAQVVLGLGQAYLSQRLPSRGVMLTQFIAFNLGNAAVIAGTLVAVPMLVNTGGALLVVSLVLFALRMRGIRDSELWRSRPHRRLVVAYQAVLAVVLVSIPIGLVLAQLRSR
ncbi:MAG: hypothetical protein ABI255_01150 [Microbacteriaceae bacterium]